MTSTQNHIGKYLNMARRAHAAAINKFFEPYKITHGLLPFLVALYKEEGINQQSLCKIYNLNKAAVGRGISKLEKAGYVQRINDLHDKRKQLLFLTKKAQDFKKQFLDILEKVEFIMKSNLTEDEVSTFLKLAKKICNNLGYKTK